MVFSITLLLEDEEEGLLRLDLLLRLLELGLLSDERLDTDDRDEGELILLTLDGLEIELVVLRPTVLELLDDVCLAVLELLFEDDDEVDLIAVLELLESDEAEETEETLLIEEETELLETEETEETEEPLLTEEEEVGEEMDELDNDELTELLDDREELVDKSSQWTACMRPDDCCMSTIPTFRQDALEIHQSRSRTAS